MPWIKRNLPFVISCAAALALLIFAVVFLFSNKGEDAAIQEELNQQVSEWQRLNSSPTFPNQENIDAAKAEQKKIKDLQKNVLTLFPAAPALPKMDDQAFATHLGKTIAELRAAGEKSGVALPQQYDFTFASQRKSLKFPAGSIEPWLVQLEEIKVLCNVVYNARVSALDSILRVPVSPQDTGTSDYLAQTIVSNQFGIFTPYQLNFRGFSPELAAVLEGMQRATNCIIVKTVNVAPSTVPLPGAEMVQPGIPQRAAVQYQYQQYQPQRRAAPEGPVPGLAPAPAPVAAPVASATRTAAAAPSVTVLSEQPLQVTVLLDVVKLNVAK